MQMLVICDTADIIDVPEFVINDRKLYRRRFRKWLENKSVKHKYWVTNNDGSKSLCFRTDAFVEWLNKKILSDVEETAIMIAENVNMDAYKHLQSTWF